MKHKPAKPSTILTPEERADQISISDDRISYLDNILCALSPSEKTVAMANLSATAKQALHYLCRKLVKWKALTCTGPTRIPIKLLFVTSEYARLGNGMIAAGVASSEHREILILEHLALAPKEVIRSVVIHECLHIIYPLAIKSNPKPLTVREAVLEDYPVDRHQEEEWVRRMEEKVTGKFNLLEAWELAVETSGARWKETYYKAKKIAADMR